MQAIRAFVAVNVPPFTLETISEIQGRFKTLGLHAAWTRPGNMHLTLKFLGNIDPQSLPEIINALTRARSRAPFRVSLEGVGVFPGWEKPRVVWVGLHDPDRNLVTLQSQLETALEPLGYPRETRPFSPHLTLGRIKSPKRCDRLQSEVASLDPIDPSPFEVNSIRLYRSDLTPKGSVYTVLEEISLQGQTPDT